MRNVTYIYLHLLYTLSISFANANARPSNRNKCACVAFKRCYLKMVWKLFPLKRIATLTMFDTDQVRLVSKPVLCLMKYITMFVCLFVCCRRDLVRTCSAKTKSLFFIIILTFRLYKISLHSPPCWCVVHSGCCPITASLHEGEWRNYRNTLD